MITAVRPPSGRRVRARVVALVGSVAALAVGLVVPTVAPAGAGGVASTNSTQIPPVRSVAFANIPFDGTSPAINGQVGVGIALGTEGYDPCTSGGESFTAACAGGGGTYYRVLTGPMTFPGGISVPNSEPPWNNPSGPAINHNWANKVFDGRVEIYPFGAANTYDPWTQTVGGVHFSARQNTTPGGSNVFSSFANGGVYSPPVGTVPLPQSGQPGTGRMAGAVLASGAAVGTGRVQVDFFETDANHHSTGGHDVGAFASLRNKGSQWTTGVLFDGDYIAFIEDTVRNVKIVTLVTISGDAAVDLDLDAPCFGFAECEYNKGGPQAFAGGFHSLPPARILDTRSGVGHGAAKVTAGDGANADPNPFVRLVSQLNHEVKVTGVGGVPEHGVSSVVVNVTAVGPTSDSHLTVYPKPPRTAIFDDQSSFGNVPNASSLNFSAGQTIANLQVVKVGAGGRVRLYNNAGATDVVFDVVGWFDSGQVTGDGFTGVTPNRLLDTRAGTGGPATPFGPGTQRDLAVTGGATTVPTGATAVVLNVTATNTTADSHVTVWPAGLATPTASNLNFGAVQTAPNLVIVKVGDLGRVSLRNQAGSIDLIADVVGYFTPTGGARFTPTSPTRILDSRFGVGVTGGPWGPATTRDVQVAGANGVPANAVGVVMNTTATQPSSGTHITVFPAGVAMPTASNLNVDAGRTRPNLVIVKVPASGRDSIFNNAGTVHLIGDVNGWFA